MGTTTQQGLMTPKLMGICTGLLGMEKEQVENEWLLTENETVCIYNCSKAYVDLKGLMHEQML